MESGRFDTLVKGIAERASRRSMIKGAAAGALVSLFAKGVDAPSAAAQRGAEEGSGPSAERCTPNGQRCGKNGGKKSRPCKKCCTRYTIKARNGRRRCACRPNGQNCGNDSQCCTGTCTNRTCMPAGSVVGPNLNEQGSGTLTRTSPDGCQFTPAGCTNTVNGTITSGTPVASGDFTGTLTGTNFQAGGSQNEFTSDVIGQITLTEDGTDDTIIFQIEGQQTGNDSTGASTFDGNYTITGGTGRFTGATGAGTIEASGPAGTLDSVTLDGTIAVP